MCLVIGDMEVEMTTPPFFPKLYTVKIKCFKKPNLIMYSRVVPHHLRMRIPNSKPHLYEALIFNFKCIQYGGILEWHICF